MADYESFKLGETVYLLNIADTGEPIIRELVITKVYRSTIIPPPVEYSAYETAEGPDSRWWFYGHENNIFHTRAKAEQGLKYLRKMFKDNPLEKMPFRRAQAYMEKALSKFVTLYGRG